MSVHFVPTKDLAVEVTIKMLRMALKRAEAGELQGFVMCAELTGDEYWTVEAGPFGTMTMIGHLEFAKARMLAIRCEKPPDSEGDDLEVDE